MKNTKMSPMQLISALPGKHTHPHKYDINPILLPEDLPQVSIPTNKPALISSTL